MLVQVARLVRILTLCRFQGGPALRLAWQAIALAHRDGPEGDIVPARVTVIDARFHPNPL